MLLIPHLTWREKRAFHGKDTLLLPAYQGQPLLELVLDLVSKAVRVGGQLQVVLGVTLLCDGGRQRQTNHPGPSSDRK